MIYTVNNTARMGRPMRVFVNGNPVDRAFRADTKRGVVHYYPQPLRVKRGTEEAYSRKLRGHVTVEPIDA